MPENDEGSAGFEVNCHANKCTHNDDPLCERHKGGTVIVIKEGGICSCYNEAEGTDEPE